MFDSLSLGMGDLLLVPFLSTEVGTIAISNAIIDEADSLPIIDEADNTIITDEGA